MDKSSTAVKDSHAPETKNVTQLSHEALRKRTRENSGLSKITW